MEQEDQETSIEEEKYMVEVTVVVDAQVTTIMKFSDKDLKDENILPRDEVERRLRASMDSDDLKVLRMKTFILNKKEVDNNDKS